MIRNPAWLIVAIAIAFTDIMMLYLVSQAAINNSFTIKKIKFEHQLSFSKIKERSFNSHKISTVEILLVIIYALIIGYFNYVVNYDSDYTNYDSNSSIALQLIITTCLVLFAKLFSRQKLYASLTIYAIFFLFLGIIQTSFVPTSLLIEDSLAWFVFLQTVTVIIVILLINGFKLGRLNTTNFINRIFSLIQQDLAFKIITLILFTFAIGLLAAMNFDMDIGAAHALLFLPLIIFPLYGIWDILNDATKRVNDAARKTHDYNQKLYGLHTSLQLLVGDNEEIMRESSEILQLFDRDITPERITTYTRDMAIFELLNNKAEKLKSKGISVTFYPVFNGEENHQIVSFADTIAMMLSLVNNAIDHGNHHFPIWIDILIEQENLQISVANACNPKNDSEINKMLVEGYSTLPQMGRGYGLSNLENDLKRYEKDGFTSGILANSFYSTRKSTDYLMVTIYVMISDVELDVDEIKLKKELMSD